jgi:protein-disulfide isomerase
MAMASRFGSVVDTVVSMATLGAAVAIVWTVVSPRVSTSSPSHVTRIDGLETSVGAARQGHPGAKVAIIEFSDFECPYCGQYAREIYPQLQANLIDKGVVGYSFRHFPLEQIHKLAFKAAEASACAGVQGKFWEMHDRLFQHQERLSEADLVSHARSIGLASSDFGACLGSQMAPNIRADQEEAKRFGINGTPSFLVGLVRSNGNVKVLRRLSGAQPYETFKSVVDELLKGA